MKIKLSLKQKLQVYIISITSLLLIASIFYISNKVKNTAIVDAKAYTEELVAKYSKEIELKLNTDLTIVRTLALSNQTYTTLEDSVWIPLFKRKYSEVLSKNKQFDDIWDCWELGYIDENYDKPFGRFCITAYNDKEGIRIEEEYKSMDGDNPQYANLKATNAENIEEPYSFSFTGNEADAVLITDMTVPLNNKKGDFIGVVGADIRLEKLQTMVNKIQPYEGSKAYLISYKGAFTSHPNSEYIGEPAKNSFSNQKLVSQIQKGKHFAFGNTDKEGNEFYNIFYPIHIGETNTPWSIGVSVPLESIVADAEKEGLYYILVGIGIILLISLVIAIIARMITNPLRNITNILTGLSLGEVNKNMITSYKSGDEIEAISVALNRSIQGLIDKTVFAEKIGKNEYDAELNLLSDNDTLGQSLVNMQNNLIKAQKTETERQNEDRKRQWANEGLAKFADIFRNNNDSIQELTTIFTSEFIKYNSANQGSLFLAVDGKYKSMATYAYDRDKFNQQEIKLGEGLIGSCIQEKKSIYLTEIPQGYIKITSGLGESTPTCLFIAPIKTDKGEVVGAIEMASFDEFDKAQREFIETVCSNFASVVESVKINENTKILLEQTQQQTEEMKAQEEEMRQNLEELQATQEEIALKSNEMNSILNALNSSSLVYKMDMEGKLIDINDALTDLLDIPKEQLLGSQLQNLSENGKAGYSKDFWNDLRNGETRKEEQKLTLPNGKDLWLSEVFSAIYNENNKATSVMSIAIDITDRKSQDAEIMQQNEEIMQQNEEMAAQEEMMRLNMEEAEEFQNDIQRQNEEVNNQISAIYQSNFIVEYNTKGEVIEINDPYLKFLNIKKEDALNMSQSDYLITNTSSKDKIFWDLLLEGKAWKGNTKFEINNKSYTLIETYCPVKNDDGEIVKILKIASDLNDFNAC